jgi:hypothetical protein
VGEGDGESVLLVVDADSEEEIRARRETHVERIREEWIPLRRSSPSRRSWPGSRWARPPRPSGRVETTAPSGDNLSYRYVWRTSCLSSRWT